MVKKALYLALALSLLFGVGFFSGCRLHGHGRGAEFALDYLSEVLDLTEAQQQRLKQIKAELMEKGRQIHASKAQYHDEIVAQLRSEEIDQARVKAVIAEHRARMDELIDLIILDIMLPDMDGFEVCKAIRRVHVIPNRTSNIDERIPAKRANKPMNHRSSLFN